MGTFLPLDFLHTIFPWATPALNLDFFFSFPRRVLNSPGLKSQGPSSETNFSVCGGVFSSRPRDFEEPLTFNGRKVEGEESSERPVFWDTQKSST